MGRTAIGSFIITAYTPANQPLYSSPSAQKKAEEGSPDMWKRDVVTGRAILNTLSTALDATRVCLDEYKKNPQTAVFLEAVTEGLSFELTKALSEFTLNGDSALAIRQQPRGDQTDVLKEFTFSPAESPILNTAAVAFASEREPEDVTLIGYVTLLSRSLDATDRMVRLIVQSGADAHTALVRLSTEEYAIAMDAHRQELGLRVSGRLEKEGKLFWLYSAHDVAIMPPERANQKRAQISFELAPKQLGP